jgi:polyisoprenoid-binding protein YceI
MKRVSLALLLVILLATSAVASDPAAPPWGRIELVGAELFGVDTAHSTVSFTIGFLGVTKIRGSFKDYAGAILYDEKDPTRSSVRFVFDVASIDTGLDIRDKDLKGPNFFDAVKYPKMTFHSEQIERVGRDRYVVHGSLTIHGVEREISFPMQKTLARMQDAAWGNLRIGVSGGAKLKRTDYGILGGEFWGQKALSDDVEIEIVILGMRLNFAKFGFDSSAKPSVGEELWKTITTDGVEAAVVRYRELKQKNPDDYNFDVDEVAKVGNHLLQQRHLKEALEILLLVTHEAPNQARLHARVGEAYALLGDRERALASYRRVLELAPDNPEAVEMVRRLEKPGRGKQGV